MELSTPIDASAGRDEPGGAVRSQRESVVNSACNPESLVILSISMRTMRPESNIPKERLVQGVALALLLLMGAWVIAGPSGLIAWGENQRLLEQRRTKLAELKVQRERIRNRVDLLDPRHVDPDLAGELLRGNLNVARPDEMVMLVH